MKIVYQLLNDNHLIDDLICVVPYALSIKNMLMLF